MPRVLYAIDIPKPTSILMFQCPECLIVWSWFEGTMCQTGCGSSKEDLMYDHFGPEIGNLQHLLFLLATCSPPGRRGIPNLK
ncbi:hypothetical protein OUZ56_023969 [Daphnia magna]|uniref:Uncharacterized protein n=1 Tax=Daphnia magna TaxID=35525 RepID=A0ABR0B022_9CRUS|nr:hypothetical protein OUZ56_023969 [Daphnia magna]